MLPRNLPMGWYRLQGDVRGVLPEASEEVCGLQGEQPPDWG